MARITNEAKAQAFAIGVNAHNAGLPIVPSMCKELNEMLKGFKIGQGAAEVMKEFQKGWAKGMYDATVAAN